MVPEIDGKRFTHEIENAGVKRVICRYTTSGIVLCTAKTFDYNKVKSSLKTLSQVSQEEFLLLPKCSGSE